MATEIIMPTVSTSMTEAVLARWAKNEGDSVKKGEVVAEIESDKALLELEAEADGVLGKRFVPDGATVAVGAPIGIILTPGEAMPALLAGGSAPQKAAVESAPATVALATSGNQNAGEKGGRLFASPLARNLALIHDVDLAHIEGSGPNGRIVKRDIEAAVAATHQGAAIASPEQPAPKPARDVAAPAPLAPDYEEIPHSSMRRVIAQRLSESKQQVPHFYLTIDCQIDELLALRKQINGSLPDVKVSVNDFVVRAVAVALKKVPAANASWTDTAIRRYRSVDVSVAVATPNGLITPVVRNADTKSLGTISGDVKDLAERARQGKLRPDEYQGGGFSISNLGMYGIKEFAAIINPPQACILAVGAGEQRPVVRDGAVVPATVMSCTLSVDHRVVDGAVGAEFLAAFKALIEKPMGLLV
ncbi:MAG TPA: pyruvate dehydrogenase complex dihydrolipoamide acetyltransferase [Noviherbaspirillum sp.]|uniref:pyruvate dehydrogenase complex dihydrolipoamide acetyltransferase n=1 Tax=Noviherbaspirillum sp. TaxID=1926288 RepID=UPI002B497A1E|nr:pyruvate dehydrogenase complex dihydrolipoamide acetyltransferase [Noviherbaspirillum sp.]HJV86849.1 pyruvate dehydrogenase complex dihydrolipoamide acetyltransferase [Noviherbaspirillum sp.]